MIPSPDTGPEAGSPAIGKHIPGEAGMWVFIFGDMILFVIYFSNYLLTRQSDIAMFQAGQATLDQNYGAINTLILLSSSLFVFFGLHATRSRMTVMAPRLFTAAILCAVAFCLLKAGEWSAKFDHGLTPATNDFYMFYYVLTGLHMAHVILGIGVLAFLRAQARRSELTQGRMMVVEGGACWWHMVDLIWMILFPLVYLAR